MRGPTRPEAWSRPWSTGRHTSISSSFLAACLLCVCHVAMNILSAIGSNSASYHQGCVHRDRDGSDDDLLYFNPDPSEQGSSLAHKKEKISGPGKLEGAKLNGRTQVRSGRRSQFCRLVQAHRENGTAQRRWWPLARRVNKERCHCYAGN